MNEFYLNNTNLNINVRNSVRHIDINDNTFWMIVASIDWYEMAKTYGKETADVISEHLATIYGIDDLSELQRMAVEKRVYLEKIIKDFINNLTITNQQKYELDEAQTTDLASYIVGLGKTMYQYVIDNPSLVLTLQTQYVEYFEDCFDKAIYTLNAVDAAYNKN